MTNLKDVILISAYIYSMLSLFHKRLFMEFLHSSAQINTGFFKLLLLLFLFVIIVIIDTIINTIFLTLENIKGRSN